MFAQYDINIISLLILAVVLFNNVKNGGEKLARQRLFRLLIICDMLLLVIHSAVMIARELQGEAVQTVLTILQAFLLLLSVLFSEVWAFYCTCRSGRRIKSRGLAVMSVPLLVFAVLLVINFSNGMIYAFKNGNVYERGPYYHALTVAVMFYAIYSFVLIWRSKKNIERIEYYSYLLILAAASAVGILKVVFEYNEPAVCPAVAVGLLMIQLFSLNEKMNLDHLTGLYNRKYLDAFVEDLLLVYKNVQDAEYNACFAALMLDIDHFKSINDTYGHLQGDKALISASALLKKSVRRGDFVARYGGDEFMIVLDRCGTLTPERVIRRLKENVRRYNIENSLPYELSFSIGYKLFSNVRGLSAKDVFENIDELMYKNKQNKAKPYRAETTVNY